MADQAVEKKSDVRRKRQNRVNNQQGITESDRRYNLRERIPESKLESDKYERINYSYYTNIRIGRIVGI